MVESISSLFWQCFAIVGIAIFVVGLFYIMTFWIRMLIDCITRTFPNENDKLLWVIILFLGNFLGAILYYLLVKSKK